MKSTVRRSVPVRMKVCGVAPTTSMTEIVNRPVVTGKP